MALKQCVIPVQYMYNLAYAYPYAAIHKKEQELSRKAAELSGNPDMKGFTWNELFFCHAEGSVSYNDISGPPPAGMEDMLKDYEKEWWELVKGQDALALEAHEYWSRFGDDDQAIRNATPDDIAHFLHKEAASLSRTKAFNEAVDTESEHWKKIQANFQKISLLAALDNFL